MIMGYKSQRISTVHLESGIYRLCVAIYSVALEVGLDIPRGRRGDRGYLRVLRSSGLESLPPGPGIRSRSRIQSGTVRDGVGEAELGLADPITPPQAGTPGPIVS